MKTLTCVVVVCTIFVCSEAVKLPDYFNQCKKDDPDLNNCIKNSATNGLKSFIKGDPATHVVPLNPLHVNEMFIDVDGNLKINITNADIIGLENCKFESVNWDNKNKKGEFHIRIDRVALIGTYDISGKILILPIQGVGPCNITFVNGLFKFTFEFKHEERNSKEYIKITESKLRYEVDRAYFQLDNLFNGDKRLGEEMSKFLDVNWKEVNEEIGVGIGDGVGEVFTSVVTNFFYRVSTNKLFD